MENESPKPAKSSDKKPRQRGSFVWYLVLLALLLMVVVTLTSSTTHREIPWSDLEQLIQNSKQPLDESEADKYPGHHVIEEVSGKVTTKTRISGLKDVVVGADEVSGKVTVEVLSRTPDTPPLTAKDREAREVQFRTYRTEDDGMVGLLRENGIAFRSPAPPSPMRAYIPLLLATGIMVLLFIFLIRRMGGAGSPMAFGRSRGKLYAQEDIEVMFDDVAGIEEAVDELREVVDFLKNPERYQRLGGRIPKG